MALTLGQGSSLASHLSGKVMTVEGNKDWSPPSTHFLDNMSRCIVLSLSSLYRSVVSDTSSLK